MSDSKELSRRAYVAGVLTALSGCSGNGQNTATSGSDPESDGDYGTPNPENEGDGETQRETTPGNGGKTSTETAGSSNSGSGFLGAELFENIVSPNHAGEFVEDNGLNPSSGIVERKTYDRSDPILQSLELTDNIGSHRVGRYGSWTMELDMDNQEIEAWAKAKFDDQIEPEQDKASNWNFRAQKGLNVNNAEIDTYLGYNTDEEMVIVNWDYDSSVNDFAGLLNAEARTWEGEIDSYADTHPETWSLLDEIVKKGRENGNVVEAGANLGTEENPVSLENDFLAWASFTYEDGSSATYGADLNGNIQEY